MGSLSQAVRERLVADQDAAGIGGMTVSAEQRSVLGRAVASAALTVEAEQPLGAYVLRRDGRSYFCPVDLSLRSWLSLTELIESLGDAAVSLIVPPESLATVSEQFLQWRRNHPDEVPHIRQSTWGIPRTWFVMVVDDERERYDDHAYPSVRYRTGIVDARHRLTAAHRTLRAVIDDDELLDDLVSLNAWLGSFDDQSWLELDYAGVALLMGDQLAGDQSAREVHRAIAALRRQDYAAAGVAYRSFVERWRVVNAFERAN